MREGLGDVVSHGRIDGITGRSHERVTVAWIAGERLVHATTANRDALDALRSNVNHATRAQGGCAGLEHVERVA